jgi:TPR repeat protein
VTEGHSIGDVPTSLGGQVSLPVEEVGASIGDRYQVTSVLGKGGQGAVYECVDLRLSRYTAVKRIGFLGVDAQERFLREAQAVAKLSHPNIVTLIDHDSDARGPYIVMERLDGQDFQRYVTRFGALSAEHAIQCALQVAKALDYAHNQGVIHRDIKPSNLFRLHDGHIKLIDFGLVRFAGIHGNTEAGHGLGTTYYVAPEQQEDASNSGPASDQYALGMTLCFLLTGRHPRGFLKPGEIPKALTPIIERMTDHEPSKRFRSMGAVITALESAMLIGKSPPPFIEEVRPAAPIITPVTAAPAVEVRPAFVKPENPPRSRLQQVLANARLGFANDQYQLGRAYSLGDGVPKDLVEARKWYEKAESLGHGEATYSLGWCYEHGLGVTRDIAKAKELYLRAASRGFTVAKERHDAIENSEVAIACKSDSSSKSGIKGAGVSATTSRIDMGTYWVLAVVLGWLGVHNFYAGRMARGIIQLGASIAFISLELPCLFFMAWVLAILFDAWSFKVAKK